MVQSDGSCPRLKQFEKVYFQYEVPEKDRSKTQGDIARLNLDVWKKDRFDRMYTRINTLTGMIVDSELRSIANHQSNTEKSIVAGKAPWEVIEKYNTTTRRANCYASTRNCTIE